MMSRSVFIIPFLFGPRMAAQQKPLPKYLSKLRWIRKFPSLQVPPQKKQQPKYLLSGRPRCVRVRSASLPQILSHRTVKLAIHSTSFACKRKSKTSRSSRMWSVSLVPVNGMMPTSRANLKTICSIVRPWHSAIRASAKLFSASRLAVSRENPWYCTL